MKDSVLIADDEPLARRTLREHLVNLGWTGPIHEAPDGETAIALANRRRHDLVFLDLVFRLLIEKEILAQLNYQAKLRVTSADDHSAVPPSLPGDPTYWLTPLSREPRSRD